MTKPKTVCSFKIIMLTILFYCTVGFSGREDRWNSITIRMGRLLYCCHFCSVLALAIYTCSPAAYEALKEFDILKIPSKATLQSYSGAFIHEPGASARSISVHVSSYLVFKEESRKLGKQEPKGDGALIFDEVEVACQLMWNSCSHQLPICRCSGNWFINGAID